MNFRFLYYRVRDHVFSVSLTLESRVTGVISWQFGLDDSQRQLSRARIVAQGELDRAGKVGYLKKEALISWKGFVII